MLNNQFSGKCGIVTGASRGIGLEIARKMAENGINLTLVARSADALKNNANEFKERFGIETLICNKDIRDEKEVIEIVKKTLDHFGSIDYLINNAGYVDPVGILEMTLENWSTVVETNLTGTFLFTRETVRYSMKEMGGKIINIASTAGLTPRPGWSAYAASKAGIINFSLTMAEELKEYDIKVYCLSPGRTATQLRKTLAPEEDQSTILQPENIADTVMFLLSRDGDFIDGQSITIRKR